MTTPLPSPENSSKSLDLIQPWSQDDGSGETQVVTGGSGLGRGHFDSVGNGQMDLSLVRRVYFTAVK